MPRIVELSAYFSATVHDFAVGARERVAVVVDGAAGGGREGDEFPATKGHRRDPADVRRAVAGDRPGGPGQGRRRPAVDSAAAIPATAATIKAAPIDASACVVGRGDRTVAPRTGDRAGGNGDSCEKQTEQARRKHRKS
jgi:hypothetical protein